MNRRPTLLSPMMAQPLPDLRGEEGPYLRWPEFRTLYRYWQLKKSEDQLPGRRDIDPSDIPELLSGIYLVDVAKRPDTKSFIFRFRLVGTAHFEINGIEITGMTIEQAFTPDHLHNVRAAYTEVVMSKAPLVTYGARSAVIDKSHLLFDRLLLPLASDGSNVDMLLGHLRFQMNT
jgi:hypothetical protein